MWARLSLRPQPWRKADHASKKRGYICGKATELNMCQVHGSLLSPFPATHLVRHTTIKISVSSAIRNAVWQSSELEKLNPNLLFSELFSILPWDYMIPIVELDWVVLMSEDWSKAAAVQILWPNLVKCISRDDQIKAIPVSERRVFSSPGPIHTAPPPYISAQRKLRWIIVVNYSDLDD